jgi:hypothetical protein
MWKIASAVTALWAVTAAVPGVGGAAEIVDRWAAFPWPVTGAPAAAVAANWDDWPGYAYDNQHTGFNPNTGAFTPAALSKLHLAWEKPVYGYAQTQPLLITNVGGHQGMLVVGSAGDIKTYDALTGAKIWQTHLGREFMDPLCGVSSLGGTPRYDPATRSIYVASGNDAALNHVLISRLAAATGAVTGQVDITPSLLAGEWVVSHAALTLAGGLLYAGTASSCDDASWRGRVVVLDASSLAVVRTFFTVWNAGPKPGPYSGGGIWGWGGVSVDPTGDVYFGVGNADTSRDAGGNPGPKAPFAVAADEQAGYGENIVKTSAGLSRVYAAKYPGFDFAIGYEDLDFSGTPVLAHPPGCADAFAATQGKGGTLVISDAQTLETVHAFAFSKPDAGANYIGNPAYSPLTGLLYAPVNSALDSLYPPGLAAISGCGRSVLWHAAFGPDSFEYSRGGGGSSPRTAPVPTAGGVVFLGTPAGPTKSEFTSLWALDARTGAVVGGKPILSTGCRFKMAPVVDGTWLFLFDQCGGLYAYTLDPTVPAARPRRMPRTSLQWEWHERL